MGNWFTSEAVKGTEIAPWGMDPTHEKAGWQIETEVKQSSVPEAGNARFVKVDVKKDTIVRITKKTKSKNGKGIHPGEFTLSHSGAEMEANLPFPDVEGQDNNTSQICAFGGTPVDFSDDNQKIYHWFPSNYFNHSASPNVQIELFAEDEVRVRALRDIPAGSELFQDYRSFRMPQWYRDWCTGNGLLDTGTLGHQISPPEGIAG